MFKQLLFSLLAAILCTAAVTLTPAHLELEARNTSTTLTCGNPADAVPFYRSWIPSWTDHYYSTSAASIAGGIKAGTHRSEGEAAYVFTTQVEGTVPFYSLFIKSWLDHVYSQSNVVPAPSAGNEVVEGIVAYVYPKQVCGSIPLYQLFSAAATDHFYTTSVGERDNLVAVGGYAYEAIAAYVLPAGAAVCNP